MYQEEQWQLIGNCIHCGCPIYKMDGKIKWPEGECRCELEKEDKVYLETIRTIEQQITALKSKLIQTQIEWINAKHPLKVDEQVIVTGYSFKDKKMIVKERSVQRRMWGEKWEWVAIGPIIKKDGSAGLMEGKWTQTIKE